MDAKRRDKGEGSIYCRKSDNKWVAKYILPNGGKVKVFYGNTEREAKNKLKEYKNELSANGYVEVQKRTVKQYMDNWLYNNKIDLKPKSIDIKEAIMQNQIYPYIGDMQIANVSVNDIQRLINALISKGYSYSTIKKAYDAVNACFKLGIIKGEVVKNPCVGVILPKNEKKNQDKAMFFDDEEIRKIIAEATKKYSNNVPYYRLGHAVILLLYTGLRIGEALALTWNDIDFSGKKITVNKNLVYVLNRKENADAKYVLLEQGGAKTDAGVRIVYMNDKAKAALEALQKINGNCKYVISNSMGNAVIPRNFNRMFASILKNCGIEPTGAHTCRHTFASMLFKKGVDVKTVSEILGHKDVSVTYDIYIHLIQEQKQQAVALLNDI